MNRLVFNVFKTLAMSMIFVFVFDMTAYMYRAVSLNQRMENYMVSMQRVVMENNYLPEGEYLLYETLFKELAKNMNVGGTFINGYIINYSHDAIDTLSSLTAQKYNTQSGVTQATDILRSRMGTPADYGDIMTVQVIVEINQPTWGFTNGSSRSSVDFNNDRTSGLLQPNTTRFSYTYFVPCLKYQSVTAY